MSKMQKVWLNILVILVGYLVPIVVLKVVADNYEYIYTVQVVGLLAIFVSGCLLAYLNNINRKKFIEAKLWFGLFEILGILAVLYSLVPLYFIFAFRNGINF
jgi:VIT1/CCC1 family predicted Fe2+/Mn2+ transporter